MDNAQKNLCIVNDKDVIIDTEKAITAHLKTKIRLHRAFSVFIFNSKGELLLQKRAASKLVYPSVWTNSVCSHPFLNDRSFTDPVKDCVNHALERIKYELGLETVEKNDLVFFERFIYFADDSEKFGRFLGTKVKKQEIKEFVIKENDDKKYESDDFCEYEVDYLFFCECDEIPKINESEVEEFAFVNRQEMEELLRKGKTSPWLYLISQEYDIFSLIRFGNKMNLFFLKN
ncbi:isopentenyl-diphosphate delta-isomerase idi1 [Gurleya vavrai]